MSDEAPLEPVPPQLVAAEATALADADELPDEETIAKTEVKPPRYRLVRGAIYTLYMVIVAWFCLTISVYAWQSVWGEAGQKVRAAPIKLK